MLTQPLCLLCWYRLEFCVKIVPQDAVADMLDSPFEATSRSFQQGVLSS